MIVTDTNKTQLTTNTHTGYLESAHPDDPAPKEMTDTAEPIRERQPRLSTGNHTPVVWIKNDPGVQKLMDDLDTRRYLQTAVVTRGTDTFKTICKHHNIMQEHQEIIGPG